METGKAVAFAIFNLQARGEMLVAHNDPVYEGMIGVFHLKLVILRLMF